MEPKKQDPLAPTSPDDGKDDGKQNDSPTPEDVKNLQKIVSEKDKALKAAEAELAEIKKGKNDNRSEVEKTIASLKDEIKGMADEVGKLNTEKRREMLAKKYPDILPELIIGKSDEEIDKIVESQRSLSKNIYGDSKYFKEPTYRDEADVDKEIKSVEDDPKKTGMEKAVEVLRLNRIKDVFNK
jgi:SMC interacting uncharacterized protein involved in chromosome segregation